MKSIRQSIRERIAKELEEVSTSDGAGAFMTPNAFAKTPESSEDKAKRKKIPQSPNGLAVHSLWTHNDDEDGGLNEAQSRYKTFKNDPTATPTQKIGRAITEINRQLTELSKVVEMSAKLKTETNTESSHLWKRTGKHLSRMENKILEISQRIRELKA